MTATYADRRSGGIVGLMTGWLAAAEERRINRDFASIEGLNDTLLRDIGMRSEPSRKHGRQLARFRETL